MRCSGWGWGAGGLAARPSAGAVIGSNDRIQGKTVSEELELLCPWPGGRAWKQSKPLRWQRMCGSCLREEGQPWSPRAWPRGADPGAPSVPCVGGSDPALLPCLCAGGAWEAELACGPSPAVTRWRGQRALVLGEGAPWAHTARAQPLEEAGFTLSGFSFCSCPSQTEEAEKPKRSCW